MRYFFHRGNYDKKFHKKSCKLLKNTVGVYADNFGKKTMNGCLSLGDVCKSILDGVAILDGIAFSEGASQREAADLAAVRNVVINFQCTLSIGVMLRIGCDPLRYQINKLLECFRIFYDGRTCLEFTLAFAHLETIAYTVSRACLGRSRRRRSECLKAVGASVAIVNGVCANPKLIADNSGGLGRPPLARVQESEPVESSHGSSGFSSPPESGAQGYALENCFYDFSEDSNESRVLEEISQVPPRGAPMEVLETEEILQVPPRGASLEVLKEKMAALTREIAALEEAQNFGPLCEKLRENVRIIGNRIRERTRRKRELEQIMELGHLILNGDTGARRDRLRDKLARKRLWNRTAQRTYRARRRSQ
ncbi:MAG: hypothetical protein LBB26_00385 [Puniceicoccales bacterium]|jgi:hypothetical protein|nr:hypothetical protein [Puniceicoccales bacterium]